MRKRGTPRTQRGGKRARWKTWGTGKGELFVDNALARLFIFTVAHFHDGAGLWGGGGGTEGVWGWGCTVLFIISVPLPELPGECKLRVPALRNYSDAL